MGKRIIAGAVVVASACSALHYSTTSQSSIAIDKNPYTFNGGGKMTFTLSPKGSGDHDILDAIRLGSNCSSQWSLNTSVDPQQPVMGANVCGLVLGSGSDTTLKVDAIAQCPANYRFEVEFRGTLSATDTCNVEIGYMPYRGSGYTVDYLMLIGIGSASGIEVTPTQINFGGQPINTTSSPPIPITVRNIGSASISVNSSLSGGPFQVTNLGTTTIGPGSAASYNVTCMPTASGLQTGTVTFATNINTQQTGLSCTGIVSSANIQPSPIVFQDTLVGRPPPNRTVTITANGSAGSATIELVELDAAAQAAGVTIVSSPQGMSIGSGQDVVLAYSAASAHPAGPLGNLTVKVSSDNMARDVNISGEALVGGVGTNPASINFGGVCIGSTAMQSVEVYANEPGDVVVSALTKPAAPFDAMVVDTLPKTLSGNHTGPSVMARATLTPTVPGVFKDALTLTSDVPGKPTTEVQLSGIGLAAGIAATPDTVSFGTAPLGTTTSVKEVQLTNCGSGDLMFDRATITGTHATEFTLIGANAPRVLKPTESEIFMVVMQPDLPGHKTAELVITHSAGTTTAVLDGTGDGTGQGDKDRETYYACSTGRGVALWPIALALLALRRRRR